jgi:hypothetical protein
VQLPQVSQAVQVTVVVPTGKVLPLGGVQVTVGGGLHPPLAELVKKTTAPATLVSVTVMLVEQVSTIGGWLVGGSTWTWNEQLVELPQESLAVQVTVVFPTGNVLPLGGLQLRNGGGLQPPLAELLKNTVAPLELVAVVVMLDEQVSAIRWYTVTVKLQLVLLPQVSLAVQVTVVVPIGKVLPLGGLQVTNGGGLQPPVAELV